MQPEVEAVRVICLARRSMVREEFRPDQPKDEKDESVRREGGIWMENKTVRSTESGAF